MDTTPHIPTVSAATPAPALVPVEATVTAAATQNPDGSWKVEAVFTSTVPTDRAGGYVWSLRPQHASLAARLVRAIEAGLVFPEVRMGTDIHGKTYLSAPCTVLTRTLNADLTRLGF